ncbi:MAG TPA: hypothetical protein VFX30_14700 [bacterium]|nr:hypothetical protein [bacterium]
MDFILLGGGCFGSFYARQLLRGADRLGVGTIHVVDKDPECRVRSDFGDAARIAYHIQDWKDFLIPYFETCIARREAGETVTDQYVPPTFAPHILMELFIEEAAREIPSLRFERRPFEAEVGTPVDMLLPAGTRALSFATWTCPASCIEPPTCPHTRGPKDWDIKTHLTKTAKAGSLHIFQCRHYAMGVGTIPVSAIVEEFLKFRDVVRAPGTHRAAMASVSSCHGLIGLVEVSHAPV